MIRSNVAVLNASTGIVELIVPYGFATSKAVRVTNLLSGTVMLTNINSRTQSQEYLFSHTQMVYPSLNAAFVPEVLPVGGTTIIPAHVLAEWSDDPDVDFTGTYPVAVGGSAP